MRVSADGVRREDVEARVGMGRDWVKQGMGLGDLAFDGAGLGYEVEDGKS